MRHRHSTSPQKELGTGCWNLQNHHGHFHWTINSSRRVMNSGLVVRHIAWSSKVLTSRSLFFLQSQKQPSKRDSKAQSSLRRRRFGWEIVARVLWHLTSSSTTPCFTEQKKTLAELSSWTIGNLPEQSHEEPEKLKHAETDISRPPRNNTFGRVGRDLMGFKWPVLPRAPLLSGHPHLLNSTPCGLIACHLKRHQELSEPCRY